MMSRMWFPVAVGSFGLLIGGRAVAQDVGPDLDALGPLDRFQECDACPEMIVKPAGSIMMGSIPGESRNPFDAYGEDATGRRRGPDEMNIIPNEHPRHLVEMDIPYAIARNEITRVEWMACVDDGGCDYVPDHRVLDLSRFRSCQVLMLSGLSFEGHGAFPAQCGMPTTRVVEAVDVFE